MRIAFYTLGCKVNQYDTQAMRERFEAAGYDCVPLGEEADALLVNTCTVTNMGDRKSLRMIRRAGGQGRHIIVTGCLAQRLGEALSLPGVRLILGNMNRTKVVSLFEQALREGKTLCAVQPLSGEYEDMEVCMLEGRTRAILKIQEGCDNRCAYCIIPSVRGVLRSKPIESIRREARRVREGGYREAVLTGIHLMRFGVDTGHSVVDAARVLAEEGIERIRLGSLEPPLRGDIIDALAEIPGICPHFHVSLQSGSDTVLARMRRQYNTRQYADMLERLRQRFPECAVTTDIICGFPGETEADFEESLRFARACGFAKVHAFPFSAREGTEAATMDGQLRGDIVKARNQRMVALSEELEAEYARSRIGKTERVLCETAENGFGEGFARDYLRVRYARGLPGQIDSVTIKEYRDGCLYGEMNEEV